MNLGPEKLSSDFFKCGLGKVAMPNEIKQDMILEQFSEIDGYMQEIRFLLNEVDIKTINKVKNALQTMLAKQKNCLFSWEWW